MQRLFKKYNEYLITPIHPANLGLFRMLFGLVMAIQTVWFIASGFVEKEVIEPIIHFKFYWFSFLEPLPALGMHGLMGVLLIASILVMIGWQYRKAMVVFFVSFTYLWLLDKGYFNNHYYLISLLSFLMIFMNADACFSLKAKSAKNGSKAGSALQFIPRWQPFILKAQLVIVLVISGINKINPYWLFDYQPMKYILEQKALASGATFSGSIPILLFFCYGGLLLDLFVGIGLWWKKTRIPSAIALILFNLINFWMFYNIGEIGIFPLLMIASIVLFLEPATVIKRTPPFVSQFFSISNSDQPSAKTSIPKTKKIIPYLVGGYLIFHLLFPFRHLLYPGHVDWTGQGQRFAWRMKIMLKEIKDIQFKLEGHNGQEYPVTVAKMLSPKQYTNLIYYPDLIPQLAQRLKKEGISKGLTNPKVKADFKVKFMGRPGYFPIVDPNTDLSKAKIHPFFSSKWINKRPPVEIK